MGLHIPKTIFQKGYLKFGAALLALLFSSFLIWVLVLNGKLLKQNSGSTSSLSRTTHPNTTHSITLEEAISLVKRTKMGRVVEAESEKSQNRIIYRLSVADSSSSIHLIFVDAVSGEITTQRPHISNQDQANED